MPGISERNLIPSQSWGLLLSWQLLQFQSNPQPQSFIQSFCGDHFALSLLAESVNSQVVTTLFTKGTFSKSNCISHPARGFHSRAHQCWQMAMTENRLWITKNTSLLYFLTQQREKGLRYKIIFNLKFCSSLQVLLIPFLLACHATQL